MVEQQELVVALVLILGFLNSDQSARPWLFFGAKLEFC
jgi:hypothetical protein